MKNKHGGFGLALALLAGTLLVPAVHAKCYLTHQQAEKICFPEADRFEWKTHRYTPAEIAAIREGSGLMVIDPGVWYGVALKDNQMIGALIFDRAQGKHEFIDYAIALTPRGKVRQIEILEYRESWGSEVRRDN